MLASGDKEMQSDQHFRFDTENRNRNKNKKAVYLCIHYWQPVQFFLSIVVPYSATGIPTSYPSTNRKLTPVPRTNLTKLFFP